MNVVKRRIKTVFWILRVLIMRSKALLMSGKKWIIRFDPSIGSDNMGDLIIKNYCDRIFKELFENKIEKNVQTHRMPSKDEIKDVVDGEIKFVCGTNLMTPHFEEYSLWKMPYDLYGYYNIITLGVGWEYYCNDISKVSRFIYRIILSKKYIHSVRDSYTERKFHEMGICNVLNTGCPTLWGLTPEHCRSIPQKKAENVITTITDYSHDENADRCMLEILASEYKKVYVWIQGNEDFEYLKNLIDISTVEIVERDLNAYTDILKSENIDYVGTRLHAGIHALNYKVRSIIIAIDNRAIEMGRDFGLPILKREEIELYLKDTINKPYNLELNLPWEKIKKWKGQFE